jgi:hypothetical protein
MRKLALVVAMASLSACGHVSFSESARCAAIGTLIAASVVAAGGPAEFELGPLCRGDDPSPPATCPPNHDRARHDPRGGAYATSEDRAGIRTR